MQRFQDSETIMYIVSMFLLFEFFDIDYEGNALAFIYMPAKVLSFTQINLHKWAWLQSRKCFEHRLHHKHEHVENFDIFDRDYGEQKTRLAQAT